MNSSELSAPEKSTGDILREARESLSISQEAPFIRNKN